MRLNKGEGKSLHCLWLTSLCPHFSWKFLFWTKDTVSSMTNLSLQTPVHGQPKEFGHPPVAVSSDRFICHHRLLLINLTVRNQAHQKSITNICVSCQAQVLSVEEEIMQLWAVCTSPAQNFCHCFSSGLCLKTPPCFSKQ